jgi:16S rRNA (guanine527-N7)-methyltransferase
VAETSWPSDLSAAFAGLDVSRETSDRLAAYVALLRKWNPAINLVSARSLDDIWRRHILDSAQLIALIPSGTDRVVDLGSGGGLPAIVLSCFGRFTVHMVESDRRKAVFLGHAVQALGLDARVHAARIDAAPAMVADIVTARALAPVADLLDHAGRFLAEQTQCLFLKSLDVASELTQATKGWRFDADLTPSLSDPRGVILRMRNVERR